QYPEGGKPAEPGGRRGPIFDYFGSSEGSGDASSSARKFYRVFDVAKTPFGRIKRGLGVQVQSSAPIFEIEDVLGRRPRGKKPIQETAFDVNFDNREYF
ncbi:MAG TPA: hypothetical protein HA319_05070, partial [Nitrosopumilaceae archaeon]|nr:hypothetical protein [Nitrosopumilaceae archaeon]